MNDLLEILKYTIPALVVFFTAFITMRFFIRNEDEKRRFDLNMAQKDSVLPTRIQAYERLIIFLERISPESIVMRNSQSQLNVSQLQNELITSIRTEFEHNLAQQAYISNQSWEHVKIARNNIIKLINEAAAELKSNESGLSLSRKILENAMSSGISPSLEAINFLKNEFRELL